MSTRTIRSIAGGLCAAAFLLLSSAPVQAMPGFPEGSLPEQAPEEELVWQPLQGVVTLPGSIAQVNVPPHWLYLTPRDAEQLLTLWGNPPGSGMRTLGMLVQADSGPDDPDGWAVVITYEDSGYISDADAAELNYDELLVQMQEENRAANKERKRMGYPEVELVGWAEPPHYDAVEKKFYWAKELSFSDAPVNMLNYHVRVLGRAGVLQLNAVAAMPQLGLIRVDMPEVIAMASFMEGQRYADFNPATDKVAAYGLAALVAGGVAAKTGLWAKLLAVLVAGKKLIIPLLVGLGLLFPFLWRRWKGRKKDGSTTEL